MARVLNIPGPPNRVFAIVQQLGRSHDLLPDFDHHLVPFPSRLSAYAPADPTGRPARRPATGRRGQLRERAIRQVAVLEVTGRLGEVIEDLDRAVQVDLAEGPRGVVCDRTSGQVVQPGLRDVDISARRPRTRVMTSVCESQPGTD